MDKIFIISMRYLCLFFQKEKHFLELIALFLSISCWITQRKLYIWNVMTWSQDFGWYQKIEILLLLFLRLSSWFGIFSWWCIFDGNKMWIICINGYYHVAVHAAGCALECFATFSLFEFFEMIFRHISHNVK